MRQLNIVRIANVKPEAPADHWLVEKLWAWPAVGFIGGTPKSFKTWLALELAVAVASGQPCLGRFAVHKRGPVLVYAAEDSAPAIRKRVASIAEARGIALDSLAIGLIVESTLRLDLQEDREAIEAAIVRTKPRLLVLDPLVRLHRGDENSSTEVSALLGFLRDMQRKHEVAIALVHHVRKSGSGQPGQSLRGSGDLHAWTDSALYLLHQKEGLVLQPEHRSRQAPAPMVVKLTDRPLHLDVIGEVATDMPSRAGGETAMDARVVAALTKAPMSRSQLRDALHVRNETLGAALERLEGTGAILRANGVWAVPVPRP